MIDKETIIQEFDLRKTGQKGWFHSPKLVCPECGQNDEFNVLFTDKGGIVRCLHSRTCNNYSTSLYNYLRIIDRSDLIQGEVYSFKNKLDLDVITKPYSYDLSLPDKLPPFGFKPIIYDLYLKNRGFKKEQYKLFNVGKSKETRLRDYIVFLIKFEGKVKGWIARSQQTKEWHEENLIQHKENGVRLYPRYFNSPNTDFGKMLLGIEEITSETKEILLVEGLFDKSNVDSQLDLYSSDEIKCLVTFGNSLSPEQVELLKQTGIRKVTFMYDYGTIEKIKQYGMLLFNEGFQVDVCEFKEEKIDAGEANADYLCDLLLNKKNIFYFYKNRVKIKMKN